MIKLLPLKPNARFPMKRGCLLKTFLFLIIALVLLFGISVLLKYLLGPSPSNFNNQPHASRSIQESKDDRLFIREWNHGNDNTIFDKSYKFPFEQIWEEKYSHLELNTEKRPYRTYIVIDSLSGHNILFKLRKNNKFFTEKNYHRKWVLYGNAAYSFLSDDGVLCFHLRKEYYDSTKISFSIYKLKEEYDTKEENHIPLFKFNLYRDDYFKSKEF